MSAHPELLVPLSALPGFDPVGLRVWCERDELEGHVVPGVYQHLVYAPTEGDGDLHPLDDDPWALDLADSDTRDRVTRWIGSRHNKALAHSSAPWWHRLSERRVWSLVADLWVHHYSPFGDEIETSDPLFMVPALRDLDRQDLTALPDNSLRLDAHALALVAVHIGSQP